MIRQIKGIMRKKIFLLLLFFCFADLCFSQTKEIQFRLVLLKKETWTIPFDSYINKNAKEIFVGREVLLSSKDIEKMGISKDLSGKYQLLIKLTDDGKNKLRQAKEKYADRQLAVIVDGKVLSDSNVGEVKNNGRILIPIDSMSEAEELIKSLGFSPEVEYRF